MVAGLMLMTLSGCGPGPNAVAGNEPTGSAPGGNEPDAARRIRWAADALTQAEKDYNRLDFAAAANSANEAIQWTPLDPKPWELLGRCEEKLGQHHAARDAYRRAAALSEGTTRSALLDLAARCSVALADRAFKGQEFKVAEEHARDALGANQSNLEARRILADALLQRRQYEEARAEYRRISDESTGQRRQDNLYWAGICGLYLFQYAAAEEVFNGLIREGYKSGDVFLWRARCRFERKDLEGARQDFRLAIEFASTPEQRQTAEAALAELEKSGSQD